MMIDCPICDKELELRQGKKVPFAFCDECGTRLYFKPKAIAAKLQESTADSSEQPGQEADDTGGTSEILDRILARGRAREAEIRTERESDFVRRLREAIERI